MVRISYGDYFVGNPTDWSIGPDPVLGHFLSRWIRMVRRSKVAVQLASGADGRRFYYPLRIL